MANTIGTQTLSSVWRAKYFSSMLQQVLRKATVCEAICSVDRSGDKYIHNPYTTQVTAAIQALSGNYSVSDFTTTEDTLSVTDEAIYGEHVRDFEQKLSRFDLFKARADELMYAVSYGVDYSVLNQLCEDGTGAYTTPAGGFTTASNIPVIFSNLCAKVMGYADVYKGLFIVLENTDVTGLIQTQLASGFSYADSALNNGMIGHYNGVDIYVVRSGTFVSTTIGTRSDITNSGHRVFGVKGIATYAVGTPVYEEKPVAGKTGREIVYGTYFGFKLWATKTDLVVDITLA